MPNGVDPNDIYHNGGWYNRNGSGPNSPIVPATSTFAGLPSAAANVGTQYFVTNVGAGTGGAGGGTMFVASTTRWKPAGGNASLDSVDTPNVGVANTTEQNLNPNHIVIPAGVIGNFDRLRLRLSMSKSGTVDTATVNIKFGPLGTVADPAIATFSFSTTNQTDGAFIDFKRLSATSMQKLGSAGVDTGNAGPNPGAYPAPVAVANMDSTAMFLSITATMTSGTEACTLQDYTLEIYPTDSQ